jgi:hypothetical protein
VCSGGAPPGTCTTRPSLAMRLPQEIVETIVAHLIYNSHSLRSCSLTCYSWYIAAVPHLYPTLIAAVGYRYPRLRWPNPVLHMHRLGLLPFVKTVRICSTLQYFSPKRFNRSTLHQFSALTNVQHLEIGNLDIPSFMPRIQRYFGPFLPTVQTLRLGNPKGSNRQIIFFIGLFQHLEDLRLISTRERKGEPEEDPTLVPRFAPPLQGQLVAWDCTKAGLFQGMVHSFGEIRFTAMNLFNVDETSFLLRSCAQTLRTLHLHPTDRHGEQLHLKFS